MFTNPRDNVSKFGFTPGQTVADFGSGSGHYAIALSEAVGTTGTVVAIDIQEDLQVRLRNKSQELGRKNIATLVADLEHPGASALATGSVDGVVISNILSQVSHKDVVVNEAKRITKSGGKICIIDWQERFSKEEAKKLFDTAPYSEFEAGNLHYCVIFKV